MLILVQYSFAQTSFTFQGKQVAAGTKAHFKVPIEDDGVSTFIPITIFNGVEDGETIGITAGVHGYEYPPIIAAQNLIKSIDPKHLKGVVILVQLANVESFLGRSPFTNPIDDKNLNRSFPGKKDGSLTDKIAYFISDEIISRVDYFLDIHAGDASEDLMHYVGYYRNPDFSEISETGRKMALSMGFDHVVIFDTDKKEYMNDDKPSLYTSADAFKRGIPAVDIECGRLGIPEAEAVEQVEKSVINLLKHLNFSEESEENDQNPPIIIKNRIYIESNFDGIFYPLKSAGEYVVKGTKLGYTTDFFGTIQETIYANGDGLLLIVLGTPAVNKGETMSVIGVF